MEKVSKEWLKIFSTFSEAQKRWVAGIISSEIGHGGVNTVSSATGLSKTTIIKGKKEVKSSKGPLSLERIRNEGGGRKKLYSSDVKEKGGNLMSLQKLPMGKDDHSKRIALDALATGKLNEAYGNLKKEFTKITPSQLASEAIVRYFDHLFVN